ncbi:MAG TPA: VWA domain-containing protein [Pyrinomonadaceae bacterium]
MKMRLPLAILLITQMLGGGLAQQPTPTPPPSPSNQERPPQPEAEDVVRITTNLVQVDAVITDKDGKLVTDLKPEEVEIYEDGREQKITNFSFNLSESTSPARDAKRTAADKNAPAPPPSRLRTEDIRRTIALVVDDLGLSFESTYYVRRALKKFVDEQMQPGDLVAIIRTAGGVGALQQFTTDKRQLYAAIERVKFYMNGRSGIGAFAPIQPPTPGERGEDVDAANEELNQFREDVFSVGTLGAVNYVVRGLRELPGRKSILLISDGFRIYSRDDPTRSYRTVQRLQRLIDEAGRASVVIYTMNATGLQTLGFTAADDTSGRDMRQMQSALNRRRNAAFETQGGLELLARQTGGIAIKNTNDLSGGIRRVLEDQRGYYLIGYRPDQSTFNPRTGRREFHRLSLKIKRPGKFNVRMRQGFLGVTDEEQPKPRTMAQQLLNALMSPFGATGVHLRLTSLFGNDASAGSFMRSLLHIDANDLTFTKETDGFYKTMIDVVAITFGDNGVPVDQLGKTYQMRVSESEYKRILRDGLVYYVTVPIKKPGAYQLRMSLRDSSSERIGSASQFVEAPDIKKKRLALSGIILRAQSPVQTGGALASAAGEGREEAGARTSAAVRQFKPGTIIEYAFFIYNAKLDKASARPQLTTQVKLFHDGKEVFSGKELPYENSGQIDLQRLPAGGALQLGNSMEAGDYVLQVIVTDTLAEKKHRIATQWMDFQIVK